MALNIIALTGRLVREPEVSKTQSGVSVCGFSIAVDRPYKRGEEKQADFFDCTAWRHNADFLKRYFHKGDMVGVSGHLQTRTWETEDGQKRRVVEVVADTVSFLTGKKDSDATPVHGDFAPVDDAGAGELPF